jgi:hypothetical protein
MTAGELNHVRCKVVRLTKRPKNPVLNTEAASRRHSVREFSLLHPGASSLTFEKYTQKITDVGSGITGWQVLEDYEPRTSHQHIVYQGPPRKTQAGMMARSWQRLCLSEGLESKTPVPGVAPCDLILTPRVLGPIDGIWFQHI